MSQPTSPSTNYLLSQAAGLLTARILPHIDQAIPASCRPFHQPDIFLPHLTSRRYGWVHYGMFFPTLPAPHRYSHVMTLLGATGTLMFDNDYLVKNTPRDTATLLTSTAAPGTHLYRSYSIADECDIQDDGSHIAFGENLVITGNFPRFQVKAAHGNYQLNATIDCTDTVSWFVKNLAYDHLSLLASCTGKITQGEIVTSIEKTLCTFEYARCISPYAFIKRPLSNAWKLPVDFFTYQIINLDANTQLLLTDVRSQGISSFRGIHIRTLDGRAEIHTEGVEFLVLESTLKVDNQGRGMRVPSHFSWRVRDKGKTLVDIECKTATEWRFGHGRGYVACYDFSGVALGRCQDGQGYIEYVDCESH